MRPGFEFVHRVDDGSVSFFASRDDLHQGLTRENSDPSEEVTGDAIRECDFAIEQAIHVRAIRGRMENVDGDATWASSCHPTETARPSPSTMGT